MTTINYLPPECLEYILLQLKGDSFTLSRVMRINRLLFGLVVPILYADPFSTCSFTSRSKLHWVLLDSVNVSFAKSFIEATHGQCGSLTCTAKCQKITPTGVAAIKRSVSSVQSSSKETKGPASATMAKYMDFLTAIDAQIWMMFATKCMSPAGYKHLTAKFYLHLLNTILLKSAHRITYMVFLPGFICPIMPFASRMRSLTRIQLAGAYNSFELSHLIQFLRLRQGYGKFAGAGGPGLRECNLPRLIIPTPHINADSNIPHHHLKQLAQEQLTHRIRIQQLELIQSIGRPISLDTSPYPDFAFISHVVSCHTLSRLEKFKHVHGFQDADGGNFLRRCRALQELEFASFEKNDFSWVEDEKIEYARLRVARLMVSKFVVGRILKSVTLGFAQSLEYFLFNVYDHAQLLHVLCPTRVSWVEQNALRDETFCIDHSFQLPKLKKLRLIQLTQSVKIGQGAFQSCPSLESLFISGPVQCERQSFDVFRIPKLRLLELGCGVSSYFNFQSLELSPLLESLTLRNFLTEELERVEPPTVHSVPWTWTMEHLTLIQMSGPPAYHFRFEWVRRCPSLQTLVIEGITDAALQPNLQDVNKGKCGLQLKTCELQVHSMKHFNKFHVAEIIETYCSHVNRLQLNGCRYSSGQWRDIDLDLALFASRKLSSLGRLVISLGRNQTLDAMVAKYGLVRGTVHPQTDIVVWSPSLRLRRQEIEVMEGGDGCNIFRQLSM
ncbi:hypothetical protein BGZ46_003560 [Entomortierella lignicola]|nr:hypothetical protein BGZ46_003560 [Entomortierella lignicola]